MSNLIERARAARDAALAEAEANAARQALERQETLERVARHFLGQMLDVPGDDLALELFGFDGATLWLTYDGVPFGVDHRRFGPATVCRRCGSPAFLTYPGAPTMGPRSLHVLGRYFDNDDVTTEAHSDSDGQPCPPRRVRDLTIFGYYVELPVGPDPVRLLVAEWHNAEGTPFSFACSDSDAFWAHVESIHPGARAEHLRAEQEHAAGEAFEAKVEAAECRF